MLVDLFMYITGLRAKEEQKQKERRILSRIRFLELNFGSDNKYLNDCNEYFYIFYEDDFEKNFILDYFSNINRYCEINCTTEEIKVYRDMPTYLIDDDLKKYYDYEI